MRAISSSRASASSNLIGILAFLTLAAIAFAAWTLLHSMPAAIQAADRKGAEAVLESRNRASSELEAKDARIAELEKQIESLKAKTAAERQAAESEKLERWGALIDQLVLKLERVTSEKISPDAVSVTASAEENNRHLYSEESRINTIIRDQGSQARSVVLELKVQGFPFCDELDSLVKDFTISYSSYIAVSRLQYDWIVTFGKSREDYRNQVREEVHVYKEKLAAIQALKARVIDKK